MNVVIDKYDTALKGALEELERAKKEFAEKEEVSARQLNESRADLQRLDGVMTAPLLDATSLKLRWIRLDEPSASLNRKTPISRVRGLHSPPRTIER